MRHIGQTRQHRRGWCGTLALLAALAGCGGGSDGLAIDDAGQAATNTDPVATLETTAGAPAPPSVTLAEPTNVAGTKRIALTWTARGASVFTVLVKRSERDDFEAVATRANTRSTVIDRGTAWRYDFPTARVKVRGCTPSQHCADSNEQPLLNALLGSVVDIGPADGVGASVFGHNVALDGAGDTLAVTDLFDFGAFYVFQRNAEGAWQREFYQQGQPPIFYGERITLSRDGNTLVTSNSRVVPLDTPEVGVPRGAVFVWVRDAADAWQRQASLQLDCVDLALFGQQIALSDDGRRLAAASRNRIYLFSRDATDTWRRELLPAGAVNIDPPFEGIKIAMSGDGQTLALTGLEISGTFPDGSPRQDWVVWVVKRLPDTGWTRVAELRSAKVDDTSASFVPDDRFGYRLAFDQSGETLAVAAPGDGSDETDTTGTQDNRTLLYSGAVYIFKPSADGSWRQQAFVKARGAAELDSFSVHIGLSRDGKVLMGLARGGAANAPGINRNHAPDRTVPPPAFSNQGGAVYVFELEDGAWTERAAVIPPFTQAILFQDVGLAVNDDGHTFSIGVNELDLESSHAFVY
jgi:hypothetical protein